MSPGASTHHWRPNRRGGDRGTGLATTVAILFAAVAAISFAVEQRVALSNLPAPPASGASR